MSSKWDKIQAITSLVALLVVAGSVYLTFYLDLTSRLALDVNAIEIICSPGFEIWGDRETTLEEHETCSVLQSQFPPPTEVRREFIRLVVEHPENTQGIVNAYAEIYPYGAKWINKILHALDKDESINIPAPTVPPE